MIAGVESLSEKVLKSSKSLKIISRCGIGIDNIDLNAAKNLEITITNTPDAPTLPVAELTISHILSLLRKVGHSNTRLKMGHWEPQMGSLLNEKVIGIIGFGRIGKKVAFLLNAFGCKVQYYDPFVDTTECNATKVDLEFLLKSSDIITIHMPYNAETHHMISHNELNLMKNSALVFNLSRGGLINENALYEALINKKIDGAGIDAFEKEPYTGPLINLENVILTPHMGSYAKESRYKQEYESIINLINSLKKINSF
jgi:D-3-phosphoglycerate dehydrogenase